MPMPQPAASAFPSSVQALFGAPRPAASGPGPAGPGAGPPQQFRPPPAPTAAARPPPPPPAATVAVQPPPAATAAARPPPPPYRPAAVAGPAVTVGPVGAAARSAPPPAQAVQPPLQRPSFAPTPQVTCPFGRFSWRPQLGLTRHLCPPDNILKGAQLFPISRVVPGLLSWRCLLLALTSLLRILKVSAVT